MSNKPGFSSWDYINEITSSHVLVKSLSMGEGGKSSPSRATIKEKGADNTNRSPYVGRRAKNTLSLHNPNWKITSHFSNGQQSDCGYRTVNSSRRNYYSYTILSTFWILTPKIFKKIQRLFLKNKNFRHCIFILEVHPTTGFSLKQRFSHLDI